MQHDKSFAEAGMRAKWQRFSLIVLVNAFAGAMSGVERTVLLGTGKNVFAFDAIQPLD